MGQLVLEKPAATKLLTAVEATLARLGAMRLAAEGETSLRRQVDPRELARLYGAVRRMRDLIRRSFGLFRSGEAVEIGDEDHDLLVQCLAHRISELELQEQASERPVDRRVNAERRQDLEELAERIAIGPVKALPTEGPGRSPAADGLRNRLASRAREVSAAGGGPRSDPVQRPFGSDGALGAAYATAVGVEVESFDEVDHPVCESDRVRDPRLRSAITLDLAAMDRARARADFRLAALHLMSVFEAVLVDFALPRARTLGLNGGPETWSIEILAQACFDDLDNRDRTVISWLARCDSIVHPGRALRRPVLVTEPVFEELRKGCKALIDRVPVRR